MIHRHLHTTVRNSFRQWFRHRDPTDMLAFSPSSALRLARGVYAGSRRFFGGRRHIANIAAQELKYVARF
jgi:hypothetical protein